MTDYEKGKAPWQYHGYPALSEWMASSNDFFVLRRFSPVQVRCLLWLQNEIATKDQELQNWDMFARCQKVGEGNSGAIGSDPDALPGNPRPRLLQELVPLLKQYSKRWQKEKVLTSSSQLTSDADDLIISFSALKAKTTATDLQTQNLVNWINNHGPDPIDDQEYHWRDHKGDLITMVTRPTYPLVGLLGQYSLIRRIFTLKKRDDRIDSDATTYVSNTGLERFATFICLFVGLAMTFGSIWWLNFVSDSIIRLAIITVSGSIITIVAWFAAGNRPFEILATFAAYMAVLMIYLQIDNKD